MTWNTSEYLRTVTAIAEEAIEEYPVPTDPAAYLAMEADVLAEVERLLAAQREA